MDIKTGRPIEVAGARYEDGEELVWPSPFGAHSWHAMSFNPNTGLVYIPKIEMPATFKDSVIDHRSWQSPHFYASVGVEFGIGGKRKKGRRKTVSDAARGLSAQSKKPKRNVGPRTSDRESGFMGYIRAAGANSQFGRNQ